MNKPEVTIRGGYLRSVSQGAKIFCHRSHPPMTHLILAKFHIAVDIPEVRTEAIHSPLGCQRIIIVPEQRGSNIAANEHHGTGHR